VRELPGIVVILAYLFLLPPLLAKTVMRDFFIRMGFIRFFLLINLMQLMAALPLKMLLRWAFNLKYIVYIPQYFSNSRRPPARGPRPAGFSKVEAYGSQRHPVS